MRELREIDREREREREKRGRTYFARIILDNVLTSICYMLQDYLYTF